MPYSENQSVILEKNLNNSVQELPKNLITKEQFSPFPHSVSLTNSSLLYAEFVKSIHSHFAYLMTA